MISLNDETIAIRNLDPTELERALPELAGLLRACVHSGASIGFVLPHSDADAAAFWTGKVFPAVRSGRVALLAARDRERLFGTVQLDCDTPGNQPHRAEARKLLVHPAARRKGIGRALMNALETEARRRNRSLITLDTRTGDHAEPLYRSLGYATVGVIPDFCLDTQSTRLDSTTIMYKSL